MQLSTTLVTLAAAVSAYASCSSLGSDATDTLLGEFTFAAYDAASDTATPLHLINVITVPGAGFHLLSVEDARNNGFVDFTLNAGLLSSTQSTTNPNLTPVHYIGTFTPPNGSNFLTSGPWPLFSNANASPPVFCSVPNPSGGDDILALDGHTDLFSICLSAFTSQLPELHTLLFNASSTAEITGPNTYSGASCQPVTLHIIPSDL